MFHDMRATVLKIVETHHADHCLSVTGEVSSVMAQRRIGLCHELQATRGEKGLERTPWKMARAGSVSHDAEGLVEASAGQDLLEQLKVELPGRVTRCILTGGFQGLDRRGAARRFDVGRHEAGILPEVLSQLKFWASRPLSPKTYWYLMGKLRPVRAVTSGFSNVEDCLASGEEVVRLFVQLGVLHPEAVTLHIGSGLGRVEYHLRTRVRKCYGVDVSRSMVKRAKELVPFENVEFRHTHGIGLSDWSDESFQLVYSFLVFQHLPRSHTSRYISDVHAKLSPGGHFVFQMLIDETKSQLEPPPSHPYGLRYYSIADVGALLAHAGFGRVVRTDLDGRPVAGAPAGGNVVFCATKD